MVSKNSKTLAGLLVLAVLMILLFYIPQFLEQGVPAACIEGVNCPHEQYLQNVLSSFPVAIMLGFVFGLIIAYLYFEKKIELPIPSVDRRKVILSMFHPSEAKVVGKLLENNGTVLQAEVSRIEGLGRVKAHRVIERLVRRGIIEKEQSGKTNILRLKKSMVEAIENEPNK
jgi:uncharacterized membrane protein